MGFGVEAFRATLDEVFELSVMVTGVFSLIYHMSNTFLTQFTDFLGMYWCVKLIGLFGGLPFGMGPKTTDHSHLSNGNVRDGSRDVVASFLRDVPVQASVGVLAVFAIVAEVLNVVKGSGGLFAICLWRWAFSS